MKMLVRIRRWGLIGLLCLLFATVLLLPKVGGVMASSVDSAPASDANPVNWWLIGAIIAAITLLGTATWWLIAFRHTGGPPLGSPTWWLIGTTVIMAMVVGALAERLIELRRKGGQFAGSVTWELIGGTVALGILANHAMWQVVSFRPGKERRHPD